MKAKTVFFHGSLNNNISQLWPFTHLGSIEAALDSALKHRYLKNKVGEITIYEIEMFMDLKEDVLELDDWGVPTLSGLAEKLIKKNAFQGDEEFYRHLVRGVYADGSGRGEVDERIGPLIASRLKGQGIAVISYDNKIEGLTGEKSICLVDPAIISSFSKRHFELELLKAAEARVRAVYTSFLRI
jgi:hypothetical protein